MARTITGWQGENGDLVWRTFPLAALTETQVLINVKAAGVNRADLLQRAGKYPPPQGASPILGLEVAGIVEAVGPAVTRIRTGERVMALLDGGGYARQVVAEAGLCIPIPETLSFVQAAALPEACFTWWNSVFSRHLLAPQETLLIHGGSSGMGTIGIQLAVHAGASVFVTVKTAEKAALCRHLGAAEAILYPQEDFSERILHLTQNKGVDVILDCIGSDYISRNIACLAPLGRLISIGCQQGAQATLPLIPLMQKGLTLTGATLRDKPLWHKIKLRELLEPPVLTLLKKDQLSPVVYASFPLEKAAEALELMQLGTHSGKIVLYLT